MYKDTFANEITINKTPQELLGLIGNYFYEPKLRKSFKIIGITDDSFICHKGIKQEDDDAFFGSGIFYSDGYIKVKFDDSVYVYSLPPTPKQAEWLERYGYNFNSISGVEAWHIIHDAVENAKLRRNQYKNSPDARARKLGFADNYRYDAWLTNGTFEINGIDICDDDSAIDYEDIWSICNDPDF